MDSGETECFRAEECLHHRLGVAGADIDLELHRLMERGPEVVDPLDVHDRHDVVRGECSGGVPDGKHLLEEGHGRPSR
eukprot:559252-Heterocapsa_arctica.AAC.1